MLLPNAASDQPGKGEMSAALNRSTQSGRPAAGLLPHLVPQGATEEGGGGKGWSGWEEILIPRALLPSLPLFEYVNRLGGQLLLLDNSLLGERFSGQMWGLAAVIKLFQCSHPARTSC